MLDFIGCHTAALMVLVVTVLRVATEPSITYGIG